MFPIIRVDSRNAESLEQLGAKPKFWFDDRSRLFKAEARGTGEDWAEKIACELCGLMGLPHVNYDLAHDGYRDVPGVICPTCAPWPLVMSLGNQMLQALDPDYPEGMKYKVRQHTVDAVTELAKELRDVTHALNRDGQLEKTVQDFAATSHELRGVVTENRVLLTQTMNNFSAASKTARSLTTDREAELRAALDHFSSAAEKMDRLSGRLDSLRASVQVLTNRVNDGDGTIGKLVNDKQLYDDLSGSVASLKFLIEDIKQHPKKYFKFSVF